MKLDDLVRISNRYGNNPEYVIGGGGNTSLKCNDVMYVKASGTDLGGITAEGFVSMDLPALKAIWQKTYPENREAREEAALKDLMDARQPGSTNRPSVETLLHSLFPFTLVVHTHPALVNGLTCGREGEQYGREIFGEDFLWIPLVDPGYILANTVNQAITERLDQGKKYPQIVFLQNHGVFVAGDTEDEVDALYAKIWTALKGRISREPDLSKKISSDKARLAEGLFRACLSEFDFAFRNNAAIEEMIASKDAMAPLLSAYSPDHIVYSGHTPLVIEENRLDPAALQESVENYRKTEGKPPRTLIIPGIGAWGMGTNPRAAELAGDMFVDAVKVAVYTTSFGGPSFMPEKMIAFINNWEVEKYRSQKSINS